MRGQRQTRPDGMYQVTETGPHRLWQSVEAAERTWQEHSRPESTWFGLTATAHGAHTLWLDRPDGLHTWPIPAR